MDRLRAAIEELEACDGLDPRELSRLADRLQALLARVVHEGRQRGDHLLAGRTPCGWVMSSCSVTPASAAEKLCTGEQLARLPRIAEGLRSGEIGYQAAAVICRLAGRLGEKRELIVEEDWIVHAQRLSIKDLGHLADFARYMADPEGFERDDEEDYEQRYLYLSPLGRMYKLDGVLDAESGAALRAAIESLSKPLGAADDRLPKQRRADALKELVRQALDKGTLPRRNGVRPHISVSTTVEGLQGQAGAAASELASGVAISSRTLQRLACDSTLHRVLKAGSVVVDVGRATRSVSPAQWRALKARHRSCAFPGCDRPLNLTSPHHIEFWAHGGKTNVGNLVPLCHHHHRLVHEGGWQVVRAGEGVEWIPPAREFVARRRWGERRRAA